MIYIVTKARFEKEDEKDARGKLVSKLNEQPYYYELDAKNHLEDLRKKYKAKGDSYKVFDFNEGIEVYNTHSKYIIRYNIDKLEIK